MAGIVVGLFNASVPDGMKGGADHADLWEGQTLGSEEELRAHKIGAALARPCREVERLHGGSWDLLQQESESSVPIR